jgi:hypothetical protein
MDRTGPSTLFSCSLVDSIRPGAVVADPQPIMDNA